MNLPARIIQYIMNIDENQLILGRYEIISHVHSSLKKTIKVVQNRNTGQKLIMKCYPAKSRIILTEAAFQEYFLGHIGIPKFIWAGSKEDQTLLFIQHLGPTLEQKFIECQKKFSLKTVCLLALKLLPILQNYHEKGMLYRNIACRTIQFGRGSKCENLYFNDLSLSKRYRNKKTFEHIEYVWNIEYEELTMFSTESAFKGYEMSRRDDLQSVLLLLIYLLKGSLPWSHLFDGKVIPSFDEINENDNYIDTTKLCEGIPGIFKELLEKCRELTFTQQPNYFWYIQKFKAFMFHKGLENDQIYDWKLNQNYVQSLKVKKAIPRIKLDRDEQILNEIYDPIAQLVELDDLAQKYNKFIMQKKANNEQVLGQIEYPISKNKTLKRKKKKDSCSIM